MKWLGKIVTYGLILLFLFTLFSIVSTRMSGGSPKIFGYEIMSVLSGSMEPGIQTGSIIAVKPVEPDRQAAYRAGDVITYRSLDDANKLITHRIQNVVQTGNSISYITKGDNNDAADPKPIPPSSIVAEYAGLTIPYVGYFLSWVKTTLGMIMIMIVPGFLLIAASFVSIFRAIMRSDSPASKQADMTGAAPPESIG
ncbi:signal peptidase I SipW [Paenibacillus silvisoli]|uniref:signal peptidase I SipW n=1 Tax=Paenibacillus silvisoli TaxID=3110539 RepID=UPI0028039061|nr:signal peptidase I [Paenibacillus silvisoli]